MIETFSGPRATKGWKISEAMNCRWLKTSEFESWTNILLGTNSYERLETTGSFRSSELPELKSFKGA
ncbi:hypothetical protein J6590_070156 [Homalodisca vitripennis]|nr:hypothetical protein J6590_070156 [Homalodisca vitripennis]